MTSAGFDGEAGTRAFFKCENLQRGGAFKIRGAANLILSLSENRWHAAWWPTRREITRRPPRLPRNTWGGWPPS